MDELSCVSRTDDADWKRTNNTATALTHTSSWPKPCPLIMHSRDFNASLPPARSPPIESNLWMLGGTYLLHPFIVPYAPLPTRILPSALALSARTLRLGLIWHPIPKAISSLFHTSSTLSNATTDSQLFAIVRNSSLQDWRASWTVVCWPPSRDWII